MSCQIGPNSFFGSNNYIKFLNSDVVAIEGPNTLERLIAGDVKIPYKQVLKGRIHLKAGQTNYLMNHLGLGDNATFVAIIARYDSKSVNEEDNYLEWYYYDDPTSMHHMDQIMVLTGNSTHRIPQLFFNNPNPNYNVQLDVMVAIIDETYTFFNDTINQSGLSFYNLQCNSSVNCINTFVTNESIVIYDTNSPRNALVYITNVDITSININGDLIIIDSQTQGKIFLQFITTYDAKQAYSLINWIIETEDLVINDIDVDVIPPVIYFYSHVNNNTNKAYITQGGMTAGVPYNTGTNSSVGLTFSTTFSLSEFGDLVYGSYTLTKSGLYNILISGAADDRDGEIRLDDADLMLEDYNCNVITSIAQTGTYSLYFKTSDIAGNSVNSNTYILLSVTT